MGKPYVVDIFNGAGSKAILNGDYNISAGVTGYSNATILPATQTIAEGTNTYPFTIAATGTLTLHVSENGTSGGTDIVGATFVRCDSAGNSYGTPISSDTDGNAVFQYVPFAGTSAPVIYYKQTASDGNHEYSKLLANTSLTTETKTVEITNAPPALRSIGLTDVNYSGLPIETGTVTLN